jgi:hypothetical protein
VLSGAVALVAVAIGIAVLRYRLYDIEPEIGTRASLQRSACQRTRIGREARNHLLASGPLR